jgi:hypothetical protein
VTRTARLVAAAATMVTSLLLFVGNGRPVGAAPAEPGLTLLSQTSWIQRKGLFDLTLQVRAPDPANDQLQVLIFPPVGTRTDFANVLAGKPPGYASWSAAPTVSSLPRSGGGFGVVIPVNESPVGKSLFREYLAPSGTAVVPVRVSLMDPSGNVIGDPLYTFLTYVQGAPAAPDQPVSVTTIMPFASAPALRPDGSLASLPAAESNRLSNLASVMSAHSSVRVSVQAEPETLQALASSESSIDNQTLNELRSLAHSQSIQVLPATYAHISVGDLNAAGLTSAATQELQAGTSAISTLLNVTPSPKTWVVDGPLDAATLGFITSSGATQIIVPDADLSPMGSAALFYGYFPHPTLLSGGGVSNLPVYAADPELTADVTRGSSAVLAANQLAADLALLYTITPSSTQGVVVMPPGRWSADPTFVATLLAALDGNPLVKTVSASDLFNSVAQPEQAVIRNLAPPGNDPSAASPFTGQMARSIGTASNMIDAVAQVFPDAKDAATLQDLQTRLLAAQSLDVSDLQRGALIGTVIETTQKSLKAITLPAEQSITLTSTHGQLPLTILSSPSKTARVQLKLTSSRLIFQSYNPPNGHCEVPVATSEICSLTLTAQNTTIKVPVQARSSGVFPLEVDLLSPDGVQPLAHDSDTVRSTAISGVGIVLIVLAVASLAIWWVRDLRHGRRARRLVPSPIDLSADQRTVDDPIEDFFRQPPPEGL